MKWKTFSALLAICAGNSLVTGEFTFAHIGQWRGALMFSFICCRINGWVNNCGVGDLRCHRVHYDVTAMFINIIILYSTVIDNAVLANRVSFGSKWWLGFYTFLVSERDNIYSNVHRAQRGIYVCMHEHAICQSRLDSCNVGNPLSYCPQPYNGTKGTMEFSPSVRLSIRPPAQSSRILRAP